MSRFAFGTLRYACFGNQPLGRVPGTGCSCLWANESRAPCPWDREEASDFWHSTASERIVMGGADKQGGEKTHADCRI